MVWDKFTSYSYNNIFSFGTILFEGNVKTILEMNEWYLCFCVKSNWENVIYVSD